MAEETVNVNPDGSYTYQGEDAGSTMPPAAEEEPIMEAVAKSSTDPAFYLLLVMVVLGVLYYVYRTRSKQDDDDEFFSNLDGEKFNLKLPGEVQEYYSVKEKVMAAGWVPGSVPDKTKPQGPHKVMAQALMKRAIADIPIVTHIQKEAAGMNKLYAQSMCSVNQWRAFQAAEAMVSSEVEDVRSEADQIEPGWSQVIWRQAMQYHGMLKKKHEEEQRAIEEQAAKRRAIEETVQAHKSEQQREKDKAAAAEKAAQELLKEEEREKAKKAFTGGGVKKGFLDKKKKK
eukprot:Nitzschia sp. Nitz4//scaffold58_size112336//8320//9458//NITZ4_004014-RA/size112336-augustus-gene-0.15-mRNA-1//-1//CDS//3329554932//4013//frame0